MLGLAFSLRFSLQYLIIFLTMSMKLQEPLLSWRTLNRHFNYQGSPGLVGEVGISLNPSRSGPNSGSGTTSVRKEIITPDQ